MNYIALFLFITTSIVFSSDEECPHILSKIQHKKTSLDQFKKEVTDFGEVYNQNSDETIILVPGMGQNKKEQFLLLKTHLEKNRNVIYVNLYKDIQSGVEKSLDIENNYLLIDKAISSGTKKIRKAIETAKEISKNTIIETYSIGSMFAQLALENNQYSHIRNIIMRGPPVKLTKLMDKTYKMALNNNSLIKGDTDVVKGKYQFSNFIIDKAKHIDLDTNVVIIYSKKDELSSYKEIEEYAVKNKYQLIEIKTKARHNQLIEKSIDLEEYKDLFKY